MKFSELRRYEPQALAILRIVTALLFIAHGTNKFFAWPDPTHGPGPFPLFGRIGVAGILEVVGGLAILFGAWTRPVAFLLAGEMAYAFWVVHVPRGLGEHGPTGFFPVMNGGDGAVLFCFIFLYLMIAGPGAWSVTSNDRPRAG